MAEGSGIGMNDQRGRDGVGGEAAQEGESPVTFFFWLPFGGGRAEGGNGRECFGWVEGTTMELRHAKRKRLGPAGVQTGMADRDGEGKPWEKGGMIPSLTSTCGGASTEDSIALTQHGKVGSISHAHDATRRLRPEAPYLLAPSASLPKVLEFPLAGSTGNYRDPESDSGPFLATPPGRSRARARVRRRTRPTMMEE